MAQTVSSVAAGRVNRRFLFLALILAGLSAILVYAAISRSDGGTGGSSAVDVPVVVARSAIPAGTVISADMLELRLVPDFAVSDQALRSLEAAIGLAARYPIEANEQVLAPKLVGSTIASNDVLSHILEEGKRGMAITVEPVVGAGGLALPGDYVDVFAIPEDLKGEDHPMAFLVAENVEIIAVDITPVEVPVTAPGLFEEGGLAARTGDGTQRVRGAEEPPNPQAITYTLMLTPQQAANVFCAQELGVLRLAVRAFGDAGPTGLPVELCIIAADE